MSKNQGKAWNDQGFTYDQVVKWLDVGLLCNDAKFAHWLVNTKKGGHEDPDWLNTNIFKGDLKNYDPLRAEYKP
jgi:hypothetical protein